MRATGIVRRIDDLGRVVLPIELRRNFNITVKDGMEIYLDDDRIILHKHEPACLFCASEVGLQDYKGKKVCRECIETIAGI